MAVPITVYAVDINGNTRDITFVSIVDLFVDIGVVPLTERPETAETLIDFIHDVVKAHDEIIDEIIDELGAGDIKIHDSVQGIFHSESTSTAEAIVSCVLSGNIDSTNIITFYKCENEN